ncbi:hypothetical protein [Streptomyces sp. OE57]|uniref:hypothetical protein n=1 Tax=Streptomyces lacaronensis TaxID=3379885 RepID=UPI0039B76252
MVNSDFSIVAQYQDEFRDIAVERGEGRKLNVRRRAVKPAWAQMMAARRRKTLVVRRVRREDIHSSGFQAKSVAGSVA